MADATVSTISDRLHALLETLPDAHASRYMPANIDSAKLPLLIAFPAAGTHERVYEHQTRITRQWTIIGLVGSMQSGIPLASTQKTAEALFESVQALLDNRDRLASAPADGELLNGLVSAQLTEDSGITGDENGMARVQWTLTVTYDVTNGLY